VQIIDNAANKEKKKWTFDFSKLKEVKNKVACSCLDDLLDECGIGSL